MSLRTDRRSGAELSDQELVARFHKGDKDAIEALLQRYRGFARSKSRSYFLVGADADDVEQEALIGLYKAARDFRADRQSSFRAFAELCITRQIVTAIKTATRHKQQPLNQYVSISAPRPDDETGERSVDKLLGPDSATDPADQVVTREGMEEARRCMADMLTALEVDVLRLYVEGNSYQDISERLGRHVKSIDNSLQRIKRKVNQRLQERQLPQNILVGG
jgi:RNA polymerase sporulation-specific sigma factor